MSAAPGQYTGLLSPFLMRRRVAVARPHLRGRVLDFGCADGVLAEHVPADRYLGVDIDEAVLHAARQAHPQHEFRCVDQVRAAERFDTVVALAVIEHLPDARAWAARMRDLLAADGAIILTTPHRRWDFVHDAAAAVRLASREAADEHNEMFDRQSLTDLLRGAGLGAVHYRRFLLGLNQLAVARRAA